MLDVEAGWLAMYTEKLGYPHKTEFFEAIPIHPSAELGVTMNLFL